jgi:16S rRNA (guanine1516-N2)-methyltransferase
LPEPPQPAATGAPAAPAFALVVREGILSLALRDQPRLLPLGIDWTAPAVRRRIASGRRQLLGRAVGLHRQTALHILDATAGLGEDGFTLAGLGARVTLMERQPLVLELLRDAHQRARAQAALADICARIELQLGDAHDLAGGGRQWDVVYLDPMYPHAEERRALPRKAMQILRDLTGGDTDADSLLAPALAAARQRVVVKRPLHAPVLGEQPPHHSLRGTQARFDIYLTRSTDTPCAV